MERTSKPLSNAAPAELRPGARPPLPWGWALAGIVALALVVRLFYLHQFAALPIFDQPVGDSAAHLKRAAEIAHGKLLPSRPFYYCSIFYPYFLALVLGVFHGNLVTVAVIQLLAGTLVVALLAIAARLIFGTVAGLATGLLAALYGPSAFFEADLLGVVWGQLGLAVGMLALAAWSLKPEAGRRTTLLLLVAGLAFGFAVVERPNLLLCVVAVLGCLLYVARPSRFVACAAFGAGIALPLLVVLGLNVAGTGQWVPLTTSGGINLSLGYHEGATGTYDEPWEREAPEFSAQHIEPEEAMTAWAAIKLGHPVTTQEASRYWLKQALDYIARNPGHSAMLTLRKAALMLNAVEIPNHLDFAFIRERVSGLRFLPVGFAALFALAGIGIGALWRQGRRGPLLFLLLLAATAMLSVVPFTVADRYRAPMLPALFVLGGVGVACLVDWIRDPKVRREKSTLAILGLAVVFLAVSLLPLEKPMRGRDYWMFAQAYESKGQLDDAIAAYELAVREEPGNGQLLNNLGNAYKRAGLRNKAYAALIRAEAAEPGLAYPHKSLGLLYVDGGRLDSALVEMQRAAAIDSTDVEVNAMIGAIHAEHGEFAEADLAFARARALSPNDPRLERLIHHYNRP
jgi:hypothetical protein